MKEHQRLYEGIWSSKRSKLGDRTDEKDIYVKFYEDKIKNLKNANPNINEETIIKECFVCLKKLSFLWRYIYLILFKINNKSLLKKSISFKYIYF